MEPDVYPKLMSSYREGLYLLRMLPREGVTNLFYEYGYEQKPGRNMQPQFATTHVDDLPIKKWPIAKVWNTITRLKAAARAADEVEVRKAHWTKGMTLSRQVTKLMIEILRGMELQFLTSEYSDASMGMPAESFGGLGLNEDGTGTRPRALAKLTTDITLETTFRLVHIPCGGNPWDYDLLMQGMDQRNVRSGLLGGTILADTVNCRRMESWRQSTEIINYQPGQMESERPIYRFTTGNGTVSVKRNDENFPVRGVVLITPGEDNIQQVYLVGQGLHKVNPDRPGDFRSVMVKNTVGLRVPKPNTHVIWSNTAAA